MTTRRPEPKRGRPREQDRDVSLDRAIDLLREGGFAAISMEDILDAMKLSRSSFYAEFGSKDDLFIAALRRYSMDSLAKLDAMTSGNPCASLKKIVYELAKFDDPKGCMIVNAMVELAGRRDDVARLLQEHNQAVVAVLTPLVEGDRARATAILAACYGALVLRKARMPLPVIDELLEQIIG